MCDTFHRAPTEKHSGRVYIDEYTHLNVFQTLTSLARQSTYQNH